MLVWVYEKVNLLVASWLYRRTFRVSRVLSADGKDLAVIWFGWDKPYLRLAYCVPLHKAETAREVFKEEA